MALSGMVFGYSQERLLLLMAVRVIQGEEKIPLVMENAAAVDASSFRQRMVALRNRRRASGGVTFLSRMSETHPLLIGRCVVYRNLGSAEAFYTVKVFVVTSAEAFYTVKRELSSDGIHPWCSDTEA